MTLVPTIPAIPVAGVPAALSPEQLQQLADARLRWKKLRRAVSVATFDAWATAIFAGFTLLSVFLGMVALPLGLAMAIVAFVEFRGTDRLRRLDVSAARTLALNQVFFAFALLSYAIYMIYRTYHDPGEYAQYISSEPALSTLGNIDDLAKLVRYCLYGALAIISITVQGGTALFYFTREKYIRAYVAQTPEWIRQMQQAGVGV